MMHSVNTRDEDDSAGGAVVVLVGLNMIGDSMKYVLERMVLLRSKLEMVRFNEVCIGENGATEE